MSAIGLTQTVLATQLIEAFRKDVERGITPVNIDACKIEKGSVADWIRDVSTQLHLASTGERKVIREALSPVLDWYQSDKEPERSIVDILKNAISDLQRDRNELLSRKTIDVLTPCHQRMIDLVDTAVAEVCLWTKLTGRRGLPPGVTASVEKLSYASPNEANKWVLFPKYCSDLNACREMETTLSSSQCAIYKYSLERNRPEYGHMPGHCDDWQLIHASGVEKCRAFLEVHNKWENLVKGFLEINRLR